MSVRSVDIVNDLDNLQDHYKMFEFINLNKEHNLFSNELKYTWLSGNRDSLIIIYRQIRLFEK